MSHAQIRKKGLVKNALHDLDRLKFWGGFFFFLLLLVVLGLMAAWVYRWMGDETSQPIAEIVLTGERKYTTDDDIRQALLASGQLSTVMNQDIHFLRTEIESLPWLKEVKLKKRWPNRLIIDIKERSPRVRWNKNYLLDEEANVFSIPFERTVKDPLVFLFGPDGLEKEALQGFVELQELFKQNKIVLISTRMTDRYSWLLTVLFTASGTQRMVEVELGRNDFFNRAKKFIDIYRELEKNQEVSQNVRKIDMRYETGAAISWHNLLEEGEKE